MDMNNYLTELDPDYQAAPEATAQPPLPDGEYNVTVTDVALVPGKDGKAPRLEWTLTVDELRRKLWKRSALTPAAVSYLRADLKLCGVVLDNLADLPRRMSELKGIRLRVNKKSDAKGTNVYFNEYLGRAEVSAAPNEEEIPF